MSKSTNRYGRVTLHAKSDIEYNPKPTSRLQKQWDKLNEAAQEKFHKNYFDCSDAEQMSIHEANYDARKGRRDAEVEKEIAEDAGYDADCALQA